MTGIMKAQIDWVLLSIGAVRPTQAKTLAVMQVSGSSQSFIAVNQLRVLGRWMRMITIPNRLSAAKPYEQIDDAGRMTPSPDYDRIAQVARDEAASCCEWGVCNAKFKIEITVPLTTMRHHCSDGAGPS